MQTDARHELSDGICTLHTFSVRNGSSSGHILLRCVESIRYSEPAIINTKVGEIPNRKPNTSMVQLILFEKETPCKDRVRNVGRI